MDAGETCRFNLNQPNESATQITTGTDTTDPSFRFGVDIGVGYRIAVTPTIDLVPRVGYQFMLTSFALAETDTDVSNATMFPPERPYTASAPSLNSLQASLSIWFTL